MFTDTSNFSFGGIKIPNIDTQGANNNFELKIYIKKYEEECLRLILGDALYFELMTKVELDSNEIYRLKKDVDEKWRWLIFGRVYPASYLTQSNFNGLQSQLHTWNGLKREIGKVNDIMFHETIMSNYIFFKWSLANRTMSMGTGEGRGQSQGSTQETSKFKRIDAWNEFVQAVCIGFTASNVSINMFLEEHEAEFPNAQISNLNCITYYDI